MNASSGIMTVLLDQLAVCRLRKLWVYMRILTEECRAHLACPCRAHDDLSVLDHGDKD